MKLYRGLKTNEFKPFTPDLAESLNDIWLSVLEARAHGDLSYPESLNEDILNAEKLTRLQIQFFTDNKKVAEHYAKSHDGLLLEIDVPIPEILENFTLEFQKFAQRRVDFEIVYVIEAAKLYTQSKRWNLTTISFGEKVGT